MAVEDAAHFLVDLTVFDLDIEAVAALVTEVEKDPEQLWRAGLVLPIASQLLRTLDLLDRRTKSLEWYETRLADCIEQIQLHDETVRRCREEKAALMKEADHFKDQAVLQKRERRKLMDRLEAAEARLDRQ